MTIESPDNISTQGRVLENQNQWSHIQLWIWEMITETCIIGGILMRATDTGKVGVSFMSTSKFVLFQPAQVAVGS